VLKKVGYKKMVKHEVADTSCLTDSRK